MNAPSIAGRNVKEVAPFLHVSSTEKSVATTWTVSDSP
jgi:hypothetical protein